MKEPAKKPEKRMAVKDVLKGHKQSNKRQAAPKLRKLTGEQIGKLGVHISTDCKLVLETECRRLLQLMPANINPEEVRLPVVFDHVICAMITNHLVGRHWLEEDRCWYSCHGWVGSPVRLEMRECNEAVYLDLCPFHGAILAGNELIN